MVIWPWMVRPRNIKAKLAITLLEMMLALVIIGGGFAQIMQYMSQVQALAMANNTLIKINNIVSIVDKSPGVLLATPSPTLSSVLGTQGSTTDWRSATGDTLSIRVSSGPCLGNSCPNSSSTNPTGTNCYCIILPSMPTNMCVLLKNKLSSLGGVRFRLSSINSLVKTSPAAITLCSAVADFGITVGLYSTT